MVSFSLLLITQSCWWGKRILTYSFKIFVNFTSFSLPNFTTEFNYLIFPSSIRQLFRGRIHGHQLNISTLKTLWVMVNAERTERLSKSEKYTPIWREFLWYLLNCVRQIRSNGWDNGLKDGSAFQMSRRERFLDVYTPSRARWNLQLLEIRF